ncbi:GumC family protein [Luteolibacter marinus]|uniref:GumC family protein n=1 Tax=Luteolibacter marinus TaxID=2776705 RepID=UPI00186610B1|nr:Wzz/FepE/Etk N-terminal domain-containing protein [Luteolibacter marinus]
MQKSEPKTSKPSIGVQDVLFVLFKHKWLILICSALGFAAAAAVFVTRKPLYQSNGKILVNYVLQRGGVDARENEIETGGRSGDQVINTELEILRSGDLAEDVAKAVGLDRLVPKGRGPANLADAASVVLGGLEVAPVSRGSNVVLITYRNPDPQLARDVLQQVMMLYPNKHLEIHRSVGAFESVARQTENARDRLEKTEKELNQLKADSGIVSIREESTSYATQRDKIEQDLMTSEAERDALRTTVAALKLRIGGGAEPGSEEEKNREVEKPLSSLPTQQATPEDIVIYQGLTDKLTDLRKRGNELSSKYADGHFLIIKNEEEVSKVEAERLALIERKPSLVLAPAGENGANVSLDPRSELERHEVALGEVEAKISRYQANLSDLEIRFRRITAIEPKMTELERRKEMEDADYRLLASKLKKAKIDHDLDPTKLSNLPVVQHPSVPERTFGDLTKKIILGLAGAGVAVGFGLAFLLELVVDRRIKRPAEIETRLQVPLMLSIPFVKPKNRGVLLISREEMNAAIAEGTKTLPALRETVGGGGFHGRTDHFIHPYSEAIRDRIVFNFQINNMTHKPKMMAVTGLSAGSGTSTIAAGLAKAFSEVNGAKVLLVDLSSDQLEENPMFGGKPLHSLAGALQTARNTRFKEGTQNLYLASVGARKGDGGSNNFGPMHLYEMLPHFRASEFDYVIFDMPPMDQTSPTIAMAGLMDKVLLVVDGENTNRDTLKWGYSELIKGRADVSCVFNKAKSHAPRWVSGEV